MNNGSNESNNRYGSHYGDSRRTTDSRQGNSPRTEGYRQGNSARSEGYRQGNSPRTEGYRQGNSARSEGYRQGNSARTEGYRQGNSARSEGYRQGNSARSEGYRQGNSARTQAASAAVLPAGDEEKMPVMFYIGIAVTVIAVITLIISVSVNSSKYKRHNSAYGDSVASDLDIRVEDIVDDNNGDFEFVDDEAASSGINYQRFEGTWYKSDVEAPQKAVFSVSMQYEDSFEFRLEIWNGSNSAVISDTAFYTDETHAEFSPKKKVALTFERGTDYVIITHKGKNADFGIGADYAIDGRFTETEPEYETESAVQTSYDYYLYQSEAVVEALKETLSSKDYAMYTDMMENGLKSPINYERTTDKNGNLVNVDPELNAVKYYAQISSGYQMIFICSENADIYLLFYNSEEMIYCTNDSKYYRKMPKAFQAVADANNIKPIYR